MRPPVIALSKMRTVPVGESIPTDSGGRDVASAIHMPPTQLPISIAQIAIGIPPFSSPGNISAPNETILAIRTTEAMTPAMESETALRVTAPNPDVCGAPAVRSFLGIATDASGGWSGLFIGYPPILPNLYGNLHVVMPACNVPIFPAGDAAILSAQVTDRRHRLASIKSDWVVRCDGGHGFCLCVEYRQPIVGIGSGPENADVTAISGYS